MVDNKEISPKLLDYNVKKITYNLDGTIQSIYILTGEYELILYFDKNGNINQEAIIAIKNGIITIN